MRERFLQNNIPYDDIDKEMLELIDVLNFHLNLTTKFCCYGHDKFEVTHVIFHESITDEQIYALANETLKNTNFCFKKWVRWCEEKIIINWTLEMTTHFDNPNNILKKKCIDNIVEIMKMINI